MKRKHIASMVMVSASVFAIGITLPAVDAAMGSGPNGAGGPWTKNKQTLKSPTGISFSELKGYERWQVIASSQTDDGGGCGTSPDPGCIKSIVGNAAAIKMYATGIPANGKPVPDGAMFAKIEWEKAHDSVPYGVTVPGKLTEVAFMMKDAKRFPKTDGWGYATFQYDSASDTWRAKSDVGASCHACHTAVKARDFLFTNYANR